MYVESLLPTTSSAGRGSVLRASLEALPHHSAALRQYLGHDAVRNNHAARTDTQLQVVRTVREFLGVLMRPEVGNDSMTLEAIGSHAKTVLTSELLSLSGVEHLIYSVRTESGIALPAADGSEALIIHPKQMCKDMAYTPLSQIAIRLHGVPDVIREVSEQGTAPVVVRPRTLYPEGEAETVGHIGMLTLHQQTIGRLALNGDMSGFWKTLELPDAYRTEQQCVFVPRTAATQPDQGTALST